MVNKHEQRAETAFLREALAQKDNQIRNLSEWQRAILDSAAHAIIATSPSGTILSFNPAAEKLLGYACREVIGQHSPALFHDLNEVKDRAISLSEEIGRPVKIGFEVFVAKAILGEHEEREWTYIRKDGLRVSVLLSVSALRNSNNTVIGFLGVAVDLRLQKALEASNRVAQAHELSASIIGAVAQGILCLSPEQPHTIRFANPFAANLVGLSGQSLKDRPLNDVLEIHADSIQGPDGHLEKLKPMDSTAFEAEVTTPSNAKGFPAAITIARTGEGPEALVVLTVQDITLRRQTEQTLLLSNKVFEVCSESIMVTDPNGTIVSVNPAFTWLTGYRPDEAIGQTPRMLKSGKHDGAFYNEMWSNLKATGQWRGEIWDKRKDGSLYPKWVNIDAVLENGEITHYVAVAHDISETKDNEARIRHLADHDALTGLPNRRVLVQRANRIIESQRQTDQHFAVVLIDLDRFKNINDTLGHLIGDKVLIETARRLNTSVRDSDTIVRLGGDEFVILLNGAGNPQTISDVVSNIHCALSGGLPIDGRTLYAPPSIGIACYPQDGDNIEVLLRNADAAMYQSKSRGGCIWTFYTAQMNEQISDRMTLESALREALDERSLKLHFQPLFDAATKTISSWEALLRWDHPTLGAISPERIIPIAEDTGLIHRLGHWVIQEACAQARRWADEGYGNFRISVNVSPSQLDFADLCDVVLQALETSGIAPHQLEIEITEGVLLSHSPIAMKTLETLRSHGLLLTLDDFGTGYSSLTYLKSLSIDRIKIDRSFVTNIIEDKKDASFVKAVVMIGSVI
ncbi:MAG: hypothetical protein RIR18_877 [Pseudomonadota bacterium]